jgi:hypothetical protein
VPALGNVYHEKATKRSSFQFVLWDDERSRTSCRAGEYFHGRATPEKPSHFRRALELDTTNVSEDGIVDAYARIGRLDVALSNMPRSWNAP